MELKFINPKVEFIAKETSLRQVEYVGRICWNSREKITDTSAWPFCEKLVSMGHTSPFEHCRVILPDFVHFDVSGTYGLMDRLQTTVDHNGDLAQTANCRDALALGYNIAEIANMIISGDAYTFELTVPLSIEMEFLRHRTMSFMAMSTRYVDMSDMSFILGENLQDRFSEVLAHSMAEYKLAIESGVQRQHAREILPYCTATRLIMTGTEENWNEFLFRRINTGVHPLAVKIATEIQRQITYIKNQNRKESK